MQTVETIIAIPLDRLQECPHNPRRTYNEATLQELAESIQSQGMLQPIVVRELPNSLLRYEIVCGHRRARAANMAGLTEISAVVREMTDEQADIARLHENQDREDVHYLEVADAIARMATEYSLNITQLADRIGRPATYVRANLAMAKLHPVVRAECLKGVIGTEVATLIARIPQALQPKAMDRCLETQYHEDGHPKKCRSFRYCRDELRRAFTVPLVDAQFDTDDNSLARSYGGSGSCATCQLCSDNDTGLQDLGAFLCASPECFQAKQAQHEEAELARLRAQGRLVEGQEAIELMNSGTVVTETSFVAGPAGPVRLGDLVKAAAEAGHDVPDVKTAHLQGPHTAKLVDFLPREQVAELQALMGVKSKREDDDTAEPDRWAGVPLEDRAVLDPQAWAKVRAAMIQRIPHVELTADDLRLVALMALDDVGTFDAVTEQLLGWPEDLSNDTTGPRRELIMQMGPRELATLIIADALGRDSESYFYATEEGQSYKHYRRAHRLATAARWGVDVLQAAGLQDVAHPQADLLDAIGRPTPGTAEGGEKQQGGSEAQAQGGAGKKSATATATTAKGKGNAGPNEVMDEAAAGGHEVMDDDACGVGCTTTEGADQ